VPKRRARLKSWWHLKLTILVASDSYIKAWVNEAKISFKRNELYCLKSFALKLSSPKVFNFKSRQMRRSI